MSSEPAIEAANLGKSYRLYAAPHDRLKQAVLPRLQRLAAPVTSRLGLALEPRHYSREFWALRDVSFTVGCGETIGIIGQNGAGKSTLLQLICGTLSPTLGHVVARGRVAAILELGSGFNPEFSGRENVYLNGTILGLSRAEIDARLPDILAFAEIGDFIDQPFKTYSSGMGMRLAFAVLAHVDADVLVIDEALAVGDMYFRQKCLRFLRQFREHGTLLFCAHDTGSVAALCERAIWLDHGGVRALGSAKEVCEAYSATMYARSTGLSDAHVRAGATRGRVERQPDAPAPLPQHRQMLEVLEFNEASASFGSGRARVVGVRITTVDGGDLTFIEGGEQVDVVVRCVVEQPIEDPIVGFFVKDHLGQPLFGDNTWLRYRDAHVEAASGQTIEARFRFVLPCLKSGNYSICAAIASGTLAEHVMHDWRHDALMFKVHSPFRNGVMIAIPMDTIALKVEGPPGVASVVAQPDPATATAA